VRTNLSMPRAPVVLACLAVAAALAGLTATPAAAGTAREVVAQFAKTDVAKVKEASGFRLDGVSAYTDLVIGTYRQGAYDHRILVLLRCAAQQCEGTQVFLQPGAVTVHGLVDLNGMGGNLGAGPTVLARGDWNGELSGEGLAWPVLVLESTDDHKAKGESRWGKRYGGTRSQRVLQLVSLREADAADPRLAVLPTRDLYPSGAGVTTDYALARGYRKKVLDIVGREQRHLDHDSRDLKPEPVVTRWVLAQGRFQRVDDEAVIRNPFGRH